MRSVSWLAAVLFAASLNGQDNSISVSVSRFVDMPAEEVTFGLTLLADQGTTMDQALQALKETGVTQKDFTGMSFQQYGPLPQQMRVVYSFTLTAPYASFKETNDKLQAARRLLAVDQPTMELQVTMAQVGTSQKSQEQARQKVLPDLVADARSRAGELAAAAGVSVGSIVGLSDTSVPYSSYSVGAVYPYAGPYGPLRAMFGLSVRFAIK